MTTYKEAGVDIEAGGELVRRLQRVCPDIGGFGGLYPFQDHYLVSSTDGVGTKLKIAFELNQHQTVGIDLVAMCVNDILTTGAQPLFFLDYFATSKLDVDQAEQVLGGILQGCKEAGCVLLGGETAEMPGFYKEKEYDMCGFAVGAVPKDEVIDGRTIQVGDLLFGLPSSGLHSNGFSLVRKILERTKTPPAPEHLIPTRIYVSAVQNIMKRATIKGMAHITGGGLIENIPRALPKGLGAEIRVNSWPKPPIFEWLRKAGEVPTEEMFRTFNMGLGMVLVISPDELEKIPEEGFVVGRIRAEEGIKWI